MTAKCNTNKMVHYILYLVVVLFLMFCKISFAQNIVFVGPKLADKGESINEISNILADKVMGNVDLVKSKYLFINYDERTVENKNRIKRAIRNNNIRYVLKTEDISEYTPNKYLITFSFNRIDDDLLETPVIWVDNKYVLEIEITRPLSKVASIEQILKDINTEIKFYLANKAFQDTFRPRIFIDLEKFGPSDADDKIQFDIFCDWLEENLNNTSEFQKSRFNYYDVDKKFYPDSAFIYLIGDFDLDTFQDTTINVYHIVGHKNKRRKSGPVTIWISDFNDESFQHEENYKNEIIKGINEKIDKLIKKLEQ